jgi:type VI protein secretion system component VasF
VDGQSENDANGRSLRRTLNERLLDALSEVAELRAELRATLRAMDEKIDRLLVLERQVQEHDRQLTRIKTLWSVLAAGIALAVATLREWIFGSK